jgi:ketosteroid isomerase-like protein
MGSEEQLLSAFERFKKALFDSDVAALRALIADDYRGFDPQGRPQSREMMLEAYRPGGVVLDRYDVEDLRTRVIGDVGIITGTGRVEGRYAECRFAHHVRFVDLYVHRDGRWQLYLGQVTPLGA